MTLIDSRTGAVQVGTASIHPGWAREQLLLSEAGASLQQFDRLGTVLKLGPAPAEDRAVIVLVGLEDRIKWISLVWSEPLKLDRQYP